MRDSSCCADQMEVVWKSCFPFPKCATSCIKCRVQSRISPASCQDGLSLLRMPRQSKMNEAQSHYRWRLEHILTATKHLENTWNMYGTVWACFGHTLPKLRLLRLQDVWMEIPSFIYFPLHGLTASTSEAPAVRKFRSICGTMGSGPVGGT